MAEYFLFYIGLSLFLIHEMDAIRYKEWKMFPILSSLGDKQGYIAFVSLHVPIFIAVFWLVTDTSTVEIFAKVLDIFMIVHLLLHVLFLKHKKNEFKDVFSWSIITGIGICGFFDILWFR